MVVKGQTKLVTPVYTRPIPNEKYLSLHLSAFTDFTIKEVETFINPFDGNKEEVYKFGKTIAGWLLMRHGQNYYFEEDCCPTCLCEISEDFHFKLPCCGNEYHHQCFMMQMKSWTGGLWTESHLRCPFCQENYFAGDRLYDWYWMEYEPLSDQIYKVPGFKWNDFQSMISTNFKNYTAIQKLLKEKDAELPEEERGGWAVQMCSLCQNPAVRGKLSCAEEMNVDFSKKFTCEACEWGAREAKDHRCFVHGKQYAMFKCDSCCAPATWDCFSNHYCERCHNIACETKSFPCPGPGKCPLGCAHPPNSHGRHGENDVGFVVGCFKCIDPTYEVNSSYNEGAPDPFRAADLENNEILSLFAYSAPPAKPIAEPLVCPIAAPLVENNDEVNHPNYDSPDENEIYAGFISQFQSSDDESSSDSPSEIDFEEDNPFYEHFISFFNAESDSEESEENPNYEHFISFFHTESDSEESEENPNYENFISHFQSESESSYETDISEVEDEVLAFDEAEEQVLPIIAPRSMIYNASIDSLLSEDTINLLSFNQGFAPSFGAEDEEDDCLSPYPMVLASSNNEAVMV